MKIVFFLLVFIFINLSFTTIVYAQESEPSIDKVLTSLDTIDSLITVSLLGTLGGLSLASASLLVSGSGYIEQQRMNEEIRLTDEENEEIRKKLEINLEGIKVKQKYIRLGIQYLVNAFFLFMAELMLLLLFFDSYYNQLSLSTLQNDIIITVFELMPFLVALSLLIIGAEYIRRAYVK